MGPKVVAHHGRDRHTGHALGTKALDHGAAGGDRVDPTGVRDEPGPTVDHVGQRGRHVQRKVARVAEGFVALAILLEDRQGELGQRLTDEVVDARREQRRDPGVAVTVEPLPTSQSNRSVAHRRSLARIEFARLGGVDESGDICHDLTGPGVW